MSLKTLRILNDICLFKILDVFRDDLYPSIHSILQVNIPIIDFAIQYPYLMDLFVI